MSWRLRIRHTTGYRYDAPVLASYNEARLTPVTDVDQLTVEARVETTPAAQQQRYWDYWGTQVTAFDVHVPHDELEVVATCTVDTADAVAPPVVAGWDAVRSPAVRDRFVEMLTPTARTTADEAMVELAQQAVRGLDPHDAAMAVMELAHDRVAYVTGSTGVATSAKEAWGLGSGVPGHRARHRRAAAVGRARLVVRLGLPDPKPDAAIGETFTGESHAWVEVWLGGWCSYDPTNSVPAGERHVVVGRGRDYGDVPPLKGLYSGGGSQSLGVTVEVTRLK